MKAVIYGAGNIGRGFIGQLFYESGYDLVFIDVNTELVSLLNKNGMYPVKTVSNDKCNEKLVSNLKAINGTDSKSVAKEIATCDIMCTAVGVNVLPKISVNIAKGISERFSRDKRPLDIIICENLINADKYLRKLVGTEIDEGCHRFLHDCIGFVEASVGRMVPIMTEDMKEGNPLKIWVEPFCRLPVDKDAFKGDIPEVKNMVPSSPFEYHIQSKLYLHNMGHSLAAYLGNLKHCKYIWESISDKDIRGKCEKAMHASARALSIEHSKDLEQVEEYAGDLVSRFGNKYLGDTVARVGKDIRRKLSRNDRFVGAASLCKKHGIDNSPILEGIAAGFHFVSDDPGTQGILDQVRKKSIGSVLTDLCGYEKNSSEYAGIIRYYNDI